MSQAAGNWEEIVRGFEQEDAAGLVPPGQILFVGSSSFTRWELPKYFPRRDLVNRGFGGSQLWEVAALAERYVTPPRPRQIVLYAGENDVGSGRTPEQVRDSFRLFVAKVRVTLPETPILFVSIKPSPVRRQLIDVVRAANRLIEAEVRTGSQLSMLDVFAPLLTPEGGLRPELFVEDMLHLNHEGYLLWARLIGPRLRP